MFYFPILFHFVRDNFCANDSILGIRYSSLKGRQRLIGLNQTDLDTELLKHYKYRFEEKQDQG